MNDTDPSVTKLPTVVRLEDRRHDAFLTCIERQDWHPVALEVSRWKRVAPRAFRCVQHTARHLRGVAGYFSECPDSSPLGDEVEWCVLYLMHCHSARSEEAAARREDEWKTAVAEDGW